jgi:phosphatidylserine/phosphatidylglycerophosphate/cardiolipin synthase-like enzyme
VLVLRERSDATRSRVVWTGPGSSGAQRLTAAALKELLSSAKQRILIVSFAAHTLGDVASALEDAVARGCVIDVVFETEDDSSGAYSGPSSTPFGEVAGIHRWHWPSDQRQAAGVLHAKVPSCAERPTTRRTTRARAESWSKTCPMSRD